MQRKTQSECREMWETLLNGSIWKDRAASLAEIKRIDDLTPWSDYEPEWWLLMMYYEKILREGVDTGNG